MTFEDRFVFDLADIRAIRFDCTACGTSISFKAWQMFPAQCPSCGVSWHHGDQTEPFTTVNRLAVGLRGVTALMSKDSTFKIKLEIDRPKN